MCFSISLDGVTGDLLMPNTHADSHGAGQILPKFREIIGTQQNGGSQLPVALIYSFVKFRNHVAQRGSLTDKMEHRNPYIWPPPCLPAPVQKPLQIHCNVLNAL